MSRFNSDTYIVTDKITGEEVPMQLFVERVSKDKWQKAYAKTLADYIGVSGDASGKVLAYLIENKDSKNLILGTHRELADKIGVSTRFLTTMFSKLGSKDMLKKVRNGCYFLNPKVMCYGSKVHGSMLLRVWGELK